jgi:hypothetical protein
VGWYVFINSSLEASSASTKWDNRIVPVAINNGNKIMVFIFPQQIQKTVA